MPRSFRTDLPRRALLRLVRRLVPTTVQVTARCLLAGIVLCLMIPGPALSQPVNGQPANPSVTSAAPAELLRSYVERATTNLAGRVEILVGQLDERLQLAPCARVEPYIPPGTRLWGRARVGLKCLEGAAWNVYLPIEVKVFGLALVASRPLAYGQAAGADDVRLEEVELTRESVAPLSDPAAVEGKTVTRSIVAGQVLRADYFRVPPAVGAGDNVRLVFSGAGFSVTASGRALNAAQEGQSVRVQTEFGRVVQGIARAGRMVEMHL